MPGVAKTTLYRRWPTKDHLIVAVVARLQDAVPVEYSGDVRADLTRRPAGGADTAGWRRPSPRWPRYSPATRPGPTSIRYG